MWVWKLQTGNGIYRLSPTQTERAVALERVLKIVSCCLAGAEWLVQRGENLAKLDYIVQRCAVFLLAKHVETDNLDD